MVEQRFPSRREGSLERLPVFLWPSLAVGSVMHDAQHVRLALAKPAKYVSVHWRHRRRKRIVCAPAWTRARNDGVETMLRSIAHVRRSSRDGESAADREEHDVRDLMMRNLCEDDPCFLEFGLFLSASPCASPTSAEVMQGSIFSSLSKQETLRRSDTRAAAGAK